MDVSSKATVALVESESAAKSEKKKKKSFSLGKKKTDKTPYIVFLNNKEENHKHRRKHGSNYIRTTKYQWWSFLPLFLFDQLKRYYNIFFIVTMLFAIIPDISPISPISSVLPVVFILGSAALREVFEDVRRLIQDIKANSRLVTVVREGQEIRIKSSKLVVGDIVKVSKGEEFPADILCLSSSESNGSCKIETMSLDGETNLKPRKSARTTLTYTTPALLNKLRGFVDCQNPTPKLTQFIGSLALQPVPEPLSTHDVELQSISSENPSEHPSESSLASESKETRAPLDIDNLLPRGASLQSTEFIYGIALYVGHHTKLLLNYKKGKSKFSYLDSTLNSFLIFLIIVHQVFSILYVIFAVLYQNLVVLKSFYIVPLENDAADFIFIFGYYLTNFILFNYFIPMSLFVSVEFIKSLQLRIMSMDSSMVEEENRKFRGNTSSLNADLSQIQIIFSDKTGTLTKNEMKFRKCALKGGNIISEADNPGIVREMIFSKGNPGSSLVRDDNFYLTEMMYCLGICHNIIPDIDKNTGKIKYEGESPDEGEFLNMARNAGMKLIERLDDKVILKINENADGSGGYDEEYIIYTTIAFTSERARSSVVVRKKGDPSSPYILYTKGSDTAMKPRLIDESSRTDKSLTDCAQQFALEGLRTLVLGRRELNAEYFESWRVKYDAILNDVNNEESTRKKLLADAANTLEQELELLGVTAIEDSLQDDVPNTIEYFRKAGIQLWMLTGDKHETAVNIAASAKLFDKNTTNIFTITKMDSFDHCLQKLSDAVVFSEALTLKYKRDGVQPGDKTDFALVIDGESLNFIFGETGDSLSNKNPIQAFVKELKRKRLEQLKKLQKGRDRALTKIKEAFTVKSTLTHDVEMSSSLPDSNVLADVPMLPHAPVSVAEPKHEEKETVPPAEVLPLNPKEIQKLIVKKQTECFEKFVELGNFLATVVCCRASPSQKSLMVRMVSKRYNKIGLAIGDGLNDVSMIQEARVGVGIMGKEGAQAARSADYAIPSFRHLKRLLAVHGRYSLIRTGLFVQYSFYKNITFMWVQIFFGIWNMFTGLSVLDSYVATFYNTIFTSLPPFVLGLAEKDVEEEVIENSPAIYKEFTKLHHLNWWTFATWMLYSLYHGVIIFFFVYGIQMSSNEMLSYDGFKSEDLWVILGEWGMIITWVVNVRAIICLNYYPILAVITLFISFISIPIFHVLYSLMTYSDIADGTFYFITYILFTSPKFYLTATLCTIVCFIPDITIKYFKKFFMPKLFEKKQLEYRQLKKDPSYREKSQE